MQRKALRLFGWLGGGSVSLLLGGLSVIALVSLARMFGLLEGGELNTLDLFLKWRPAEPRDDRLTLLEITDADIQALGTYPIPDADLTELLVDLKTYNPRVIGLDIFRDMPVAEPFQEAMANPQLQHQNLISLLQNSPDIVVIEKILGFPVFPPEAISPTQVGFADVLVDRDGFVRRSLLASPSEFDGEYHLSFTLQLAAKYLEAEGFTITNGLRDINTLRFNDIELFRVKPNSGGYFEQDTGDNPVVLINFRNREEPFRKVTLSQFKAKDFESDWFRDRIVIVGMTASSTKDYVNSSVIGSNNPGLVPGVELQAHAVSHLVSAVLDGRLIFQTLASPWEYGLIIVSGLLGISLVHSRRSLAADMAIFFFLGVAVIASSYGFILLGFWLPVLPIGIVYFLNGGSTLLYQIYQHEQGLRIRLDERQRIIEQSYNTIHNGPLQTLKALIRRATTEETELSSQSLARELHNIDVELRHIYEFMQREYSTLQSQVYLTHENAIDLNDPLHELLHQVYRSRIAESQDYFAMIKVTVTDFCPIDASALTLDDRENIVRFLEEALRNVEQHATNVTRLTVICKQVEDIGLVQVIDNGRGLPGDALPCDNTNRKVHRGRGSRHAKAIARRLRGRFDRRSHDRRGTVCELRWPVKPPSRWQNWQSWWHHWAQDLPTKLP